MTWALVTLSENPALRRAASVEPPTQPLEGDGLTRRQSLRLKQALEDHPSSCCRQAAEKSRLSPSETHR